MVDHLSLPASDLIKLQSDSSRNPLDLVRFPFQAIKDTSDSGAGSIRPCKIHVNDGRSSSYSELGVIRVQQLLRQPADILQGSLD